MVSWCVADSMAGAARHDCGRAKVKLDCELLSAPMEAKLAGWSGFHGTDRRGHCQVMGPDGEDGRTSNWLPHGTMVWCALAKKLWLATNCMSLSHPGYGPFMCAALSYTVANTADPDTARC